MKPRPRIRKTVKCGGAVITVLLAILWLGSSRARVRYHGLWGTSLSVDAGMLEISRNGGPSWRPLPGLTLAWGDARALRWSPYFGDSLMGWDAGIPLWTLVIPLTGVTALAWRLDTLARRRESTGSCPACGYALAGLPAWSPCPECGRADSPPRHGDTEGAPRKPD